ncbi:DUF1778 domain-containing protein [Herbiconiux sp. L3-i23]|uniref:type II toxin-antitoxin system TacA family antitoxin n=1 Tax=Herbiconiux sp. L3-i23 TaxID=2905871 RepID=UPI00206AA8B9|nr:DUF1778 domain-containing protein [Herbiconiux sp. L3-i23]BDI21665.1 hypothetical protein L3i23_04410 [Herbiconiux sp. L3-i23]
MTRPKRSERLELRVTPTQKEEIEQAAAIEGRSVTDFSVSALVREAEEVIRVERELHMTEESWAAFNAILDGPPRSVSGLADLLRRPSAFVD